MDGGFTYGDIIVIGAIAAFILLRYRAMLGTGTPPDTSLRSKPAPISEYERVIQLPAARLAETTEKKEIARDSYGSLAEKFIAMRAIDREFTPEEFLQGARTAYEMVITAFNKSDRDTLKMLLSPALYSQFDTSLKQAENKGERAETTLVAIKSATLAEATLVGSLATITVDFVSDQIHLLRSAEGTIIEGNPSEQHVVEDRWVFTRTLTSSDPSWMIIET